MNQTEAKLKAAIRAMYADNWPPLLIEKTIKEAHQEVKQFFKIDKK